MAADDFQPEPSDLNSFVPAGLRIDSDNLSGPQISDYDLGSGALRCLSFWARKVSTRSFKLCRLTVILIGASGLLARADDFASTNSDHNAIPAVQPTDKPLLWHIEPQRQWIDRGTPQESSKTTLRLEATPQKYLSLIRLDIPFVDEKNGDPITPHLGDILLRFETVSQPVGITGWQFFMETIFPSAKPESLGTGKYQLAPATEVWVPIWDSARDQAPPVWRTGAQPLVEQFVSVAGDPSRTNIDYTKIELQLQGSWRNKVSLKLNPKFMVNYVGGVSSAAVFEFEPHWNINRHWELDLTLGHSLWGVGEPGTYQKKLEFWVRFNF
jgi:hypothetical protein